MNLYLVSGTTNGLGAALQRALLASRDNYLVTLSRAPDVGVVAAHHSNHSVDLANAQALSAALGHIETQLAGQTFSRAVLINNAGIIAPIGRFDDLGSAALALNMQVNLLAPMQLAGWFAAFTRTIAAQRLIINISSGAAARPIAGWSAYCAAKAGLEMATRVAALEAAASDPALSICSLAPGVIDTPMQQTVRASNANAFPDVARFRAMKADGLLRPADDVARDILRLIDSGKLGNGSNVDIRELST